jgi:hypothetical protein
LLSPLWFSTSKFGFGLFSSVVSFASHFSLLYLF